MIARLSEAAIAAPGRSVGYGRDAEVERVSKRVGKDRAPWRTNVDFENRSDQGP